MKNHTYIFNAPEGMYYIEAHCFKEAWKMHSEAIGDHRQYRPTMMGFYIRTSECRHWTTTESLENINN